MRRFDLTSRQYNALDYSLKGMETSIRELRPVHVADLRARIEAVDAKLDRETNPAKLHHLQRRRARLEDRLARLQAEVDPRMCFGSRKLFNAQHHLDENGFDSHEAWLEAWKQKRSSQFFVLGSKDESAGCQGCQITHIEHDRFRIRLRLNGSERRTLSFEVRFAYGADYLVEALAQKQALSYRFKRDEKGWRVFATTKALEVQQQSHAATGCIGVDLNVGFVSLAETDRFGNVIDSKNISMPLEGTSINSSTTVIAHCVQAIVAQAVRAGKPISIERLNFAKKKAQLSYASPGRQRVLSSFAYRKFEQILAARAHDAGIEIVSVNPAYSSKIGRQKYARRYGLSVHLAAAFVLARRAQKFHDRYVSSHRGHSTVTCKDGGRHVSAGVEKTPRSRKSVEQSSQDDPRRFLAAFAQQAFTSDPPVQPGGTPGRESSAVRVRPTSRISSSARDF